MAKRSAAAPAAPKSKAAKPGDRYKEGIVCKITDAGVYLGREAEKDETCPANHKEYEFGGTRVILSDDQGPIDTANLHRA
jgi:hypothetical protein